MKEIVDVVTQLLERAGLETQVTKNSISLLLILLFFYLLTKLVYEIVLKIIIVKDKYVLNKNLSPYYSKSDVNRATDYYIRSKYQNVAPSEEDEPGRRYIASAKNDLLKLFLKKVFTIQASDNKFYLILADSGMGKTTFMLNLYLKYKNRLNVFHRVNLDIALIPLGSPDASDKIKLIKQPEQTILLLDAFDEDVNAIERHDFRMNELLREVKDFRYILITCRTQFFPTEEEEPYRTGYYSFGAKNTEYNFQKIYLSTFDENDIKKYLKKRYVSSFSPKYKKAKKIVEKSPNLVVRPLLLSYIDELIDTPVAFSSTYQIYSALIEKWIIRESNKPGIREKYGSEYHYKELLYKLSEELSYNIYKMRKIRGGYYITKDEKLNNIGELQLADVDNEYKVTDAEIKSKSLLNRNSQGRYKFSHKSILEYFLAKRLMVDIDLYREFDFVGMDNVLKFIKEIATNEKINSSKDNLEEITHIEIVQNNIANINYLFQCKNLEVITYYNKDIALFKELVAVMLLNKLLKTKPIVFESVVKRFNGNYFFIKDDQPNSLVHYLYNYVNSLTLLEIYEIIPISQSLDRVNEEVDFNKYKWLQVFLLNRLDNILLNESSYLEEVFELDDIGSEIVTSIDESEQQLLLEEEYNKHMRYVVRYIDNPIAPMDLLKLWMYKFWSQYNSRKINETLELCDQFAKLLILSRHFLPKCKILFSSSKTTP